VEIKIEDHLSPAGQAQYASFRGIPYSTMLITPIYHCSSSMIYPTYDTIAGPLKHLTVGWAW
jgi:hypothetical protein